MTVGAMKCLGLPKRKRYSIRTPAMKEAVKLRKEAFWAWLSQGSPEAADWYWEYRSAAALMFTKPGCGRGLGRL